MEARLKRVSAWVVPSAFATLLAVTGSSEAQTPGKQAWTQAATSGGLHNTGQTRSVSYAPRAAAVPKGAVITQVYADRRYAGNAAVQTSLCWNGFERCVDIVGPHLNTQAFNGLDAQRPMSLVHRLLTRSDSPSPLYIQGNVTVWFSAPEARSEP